METSEHRRRLHVPLTVHDALRRGRAAEAVKYLRHANAELDEHAALEVLQRLGRGEPVNRLEDEAPSGALPPQTDTLPTDVAAKLATGNALDAARCLREKQPGLGEAEALEAVQRHASPLLRQAREETVVPGDSGRYGWVLWTLGLVAAGFALALAW